MKNKLSGKLDFTDEFLSKRPYLKGLSIKVECPRCKTEQTHSLDDNYPYKLDSNGNCTISFLCSNTECETGIDLESKLSIEFNLKEELSSKEKLEWLVKHSVESGSISKAKGSEILNIPLIDFTRWKDENPNEKEKGPGYHLYDIKKGTLGELSKVQEELDEALDAEKQGVSLMLLIELSDMIGAIKSVAEKHGKTLDDLIKMQEVTERAFKSGRRK